MDIYLFYLLVKANVLDRLIFKALKIALLDQKVALQKI